MEQIKKIKLNKKTILVVAFIGILLMVMGGAGSNKSESISASDEERLQEILSQIDGVGKTKIMLSTKQETPSAFSNNEETTEYIGAVVLAEGGGKSNVKEKIIKAVKAVTGLDAHKIVVYKLGNS